MPCNSSQSVHYRPPITKKNVMPASLEMCTQRKYLTPRTHACAKCAQVFQYIQIFDRTLLQDPLLKGLNTRSVIKGSDIEMGSFFPISSNNCRTCCWMYPTTSPKARKMTAICRLKLSFYCSDTTFDICRTHFETCLNSCPTEKGKTYYIPVRYNTTCKQQINKKLFL